MEYARFALHLLPTLTVVVLAWIILRAVSVRVTWRRAPSATWTTRPPEPIREAARGTDLTAPREAPGSRQRSAAPPLRPHAA